MLFFLHHSVYNSVPDEGEVLGGYGYSVEKGTGNCLPIVIFDEKLIPVNGWAFADLQ